MSENLPTGWAWTTLDSIANVSGGVTKDAKRQSDPTFVEVPYLRVANVQRGYLDLDDVTTIRVSPIKAEALRLRVGDVLFNEGGDRDKLGRGWVWDGRIENCIHQNHVFRARPLDPAIQPKFLSWYANLLGRSWFESHAKQTTNLASISMSTLRALPVPLPPAEEQARIVIAVEEQLSRLDDGVKALLKVQRRVVQLRQAALAQRVDARWPEVALGDVLLSLRNGVYVSRPAVRGPGVPILRISAVRPNALDVGDVRWAPETGDYEGFFVQAGDLLFTRYSGNPRFVGSCAVVPTLVESRLHPDKLIRGVVDRARANPRFLSLVINAGPTRLAIESRLKTTAGQVGIAGRQLRTVPVPLPSLATQDAFAADMERKLSILDALATNVNAAIARAGALRRALLHSAVLGKLVRQNPSDDPACIVLERIRNARGFASGLTGGKGV